MHQYKLVVFDLDGTLLDTSEGIKDSVRYTIDKFGFHSLTDNELDSFIGPPIQNSFANAYNLEGEILQDIATVFRNRYKDYDLLKANLYEGILELFECLVTNGIKPSVATYNRQDYAITLLNKFGFNKYTDIMMGGDHENKLKKKDIIENAIKAAGVTDKSRVVMIGDSENDAIGAEGMGIDFIGVTYGFGFKNADDVNKYQNVGVADNVSELKDILLSL